jgi:hypothetical protein
MPGATGWARWAARWSTAATRWASRARCTRTARSPANPASGYSLIEASDLDDALAKAKGCPHLQGNGTIEIAETFDM